MPQEEIKTNCLKNTENKNLTKENHTVIRTFDENFKSYTTGNSTYSFCVKYKVNTKIRRDIVRKL